MKWHGYIGLGETKETSPGIWEEVVNRVHVTGEIVRDVQRDRSTNNLNDDIEIDNKFSIVTNQYIITHIKAVKYLEYLGTRWKVRDIDVTRYPRVIMTIGGVYTENE